MPDTTNRLGLPFIIAGQAQKELAHNEALTQLDMLVGAVVVAVAPASVPATPVPGQMWIIGPAPTGAWAGKAQNLACWTSGGWRFFAPFTGFQVWSLADTKSVLWTGTDWVIGQINAAQFKVNGLQVVGAQRPAITAPTGGATVDSAARVAIGTILAALVAHGLIAP
jgi:Protein of unknown function (DUF2793)